MKATLERLVGEHGAPKVIRSDNGKEFTAVKVTKWMTDKIARGPVAKASPQQDCFIERLNGTMRRSSCWTGSGFTTCSRPGS